MHRSILLSIVLQPCPCHGRVWFIFNIQSYSISTSHVRGVTAPHTPHRRRLLTLDHHLDGAARPGLGRLERVEGLLQREPVRDQRLDVNLHIN